MTMRSLLFILLSSCFTSAAALESYELQNFGKITVEDDSTLCLSHDGEAPEFKHRISAYGYEFKFKDPIKTHVISSEKDGSSSISLTIGDNDAFLSTDLSEQNKEIVTRYISSNKFSNQHAAAIFLDEGVNFKKRIGGDRELLYIESTNRSRVVGPLNAPAIGYFVFTFTPSIKCQFTITKV